MGTRTVNVQCLRWAGLLVVSVGLSVSASGVLAGQESVETGRPEQAVGASPGGSRDAPSEGSKRSAASPVPEFERRIKLIEQVRDEQIVEVKKHRAVVRGCSEKIGAADDKSLTQRLTTTLDAYRYWSEQLANVEISAIKAKANLDKLREISTLWQQLDPSLRRQVAPTSIDQNLEKSIKEADLDLQSKVIMQEAFASKMNKVRVEGQAGQSALNELEYAKRDLQRAEGVLDRINQNLDNPLQGQAPDATAPGEISATGEL